MPEHALRMAVAYGGGWGITAAEWLAWLEAALALDRDDLPKELSALARRRAGFTAYWAGQAGRGEAHLRVALAEYRTLGDPTAVADCLGGLSGFALERGDVDRARELLDEALRLLPDVKERWVRTELMLQRADLALHEGQHQKAREVLQQLIAEARSKGTIAEVARGVARLADVDRLDGQLDAAESRYREALDLGLAGPSRGVVHASLSGLACIAALRGDAYRAGLFWGAFEAHEREIGRLTASDRAQAESTLAVVFEHADFGRGRAVTASLPSANGLQAALGG